MACELFPAIHRTFAGTALELFWAAAWMFLALLGYLIRDWRHLQLAITLPGVIAIALIWSVLSTSRFTQCCCPRGNSLSSRILEDQFTSPCPWTSSPCPCYRTTSLAICPWTTSLVLVLGLKVLVLVLVLESSVLDSNSGFNCAYQLKYIWQSLSVQT